MVFSVLLAGCGTVWDKHTRKLEEAQARGDVDAALQEQRWLARHAFHEAPRAERGARRDVDRYLNLARLASQAGEVGEAVETLRLALQTDPERGEEVLAQLRQVPLSAALRERVEAEFRWNLRVLLPTTNLPEDDMLPCWSYRAYEVRLRHSEVRMGLGAGERRVSYDARPWIYQANMGTWRAEGDWIQDYSAETELVGGSPRPRYRAVIAADGGFFVDGIVPPCHLRSWTGPFDTRNRALFVAQRLPQNAP